MTSGALKEPCTPGLGQGEMFLPLLGAGVLVPAWAPAATSWAAGTARGSSPGPLHPLHHYNAAVIPNLHSAPPVHAASLQGSPSWRYI